MTFLRTMKISRPSRLSKHRRNVLRSMSNNSLHPLHTGSLPKIGIKQREPLGILKWCVKEAKLNHMMIQVPTAISLWTLPSNIQSTKSFKMPLAMWEGITNTLQLTIDSSRSKHKKFTKGIRTIPCTSNLSQAMIGWSIEVRRRTRIANSRYRFKIGGTKKEAKEWNLISLAEVGMKTFSTNFRASSTISYVSLIVIDVFRNYLS